MQTEIVISGFGGQGALFAGQLLAYAAMDEGRRVTWIPSYGPEMRGGTAHCTVIISDEDIGSPLVRRPTAAIVMNMPSLDKYEPLSTPGGVLVVNTSLTTRRAGRADIHVVEAPANAIARGRRCPVATTVWEVANSIWCDRVRQEVGLLEERIYPGERLPDGGAYYQVHGRKCTLGIECNLAGYPCCWAFTNPNYDPFLEEQPVFNAKTPSGRF